MRKYLIFIVCLGLTFWLDGCSGDNGGTDAGDQDARDGSDGGGDGADAADAADDDGWPDPACLTHGAGPYALQFTDVTVEMGLGPDGLNMTGSGVTVGDINGDRWPDLALTLGQSVREDYRNPAGLYRLLRNARGAEFLDFTWVSGLFTARDGQWGRASTFILFADVDNAASLPDRTSLLFNDGSGMFTHAPKQSFTSDQYDPVVGVAFLDYDRDGYLDVFVGHHYGRYGYLTATVQDNLFRGDGLGGFSDVTDAAGLTTYPYNPTTAADGTNHKPTWGVTACDVDGDGWTDLMTANYGRQFNAFYRNVAGVFSDLTLTSGFASDENEDFTDNQFYLCFCQAHPTEPVCQGAGTPLIVCDGLEDSWGPGFDDQPFRLGGNSSNTVCGDVDNDGDMDLLAVELAHWHIGQSSDKTELLVNDGFPANPFVRPGNEATGLTREHIRSWNEGDLGGALCDFDNDGKLDVLVASSDYPSTFSLLWQQGADGTFTEVGETAGARIQRAHGLALVDYDRDGDYDLVVGTSLMRWSASDVPPKPDDAYAYLLRNDTGQAANKLMFHLIGKGPPGGSNRDAVGARITVTAGGVTHIREIQGGYGLTGFQQDPLMIIGIGDTCVAEEVKIRWPNAAGSEVTYQDVPANYVMILEEDQPPVFKTLEEYTAR
jgi:hypothetical protein